MIFIIVCSGIILIPILLSLYIVRRTLYPRVRNYDLTLDKEIESEKFTRDFFDALEKEEIYIESKFGYKLHGMWLPCNSGNRVIILAHGYRYSLYGSVKYVEIFHKLGFNVFIYDHRFHGLSGGPNTTFGYKEKHDLKTVIDYLEDKIGDDIIIGTHGESLGGATVLQHASFDHRVKFVISDCAFADMKKQIVLQLESVYKIPKIPIIYIVSLLTKIFTGAFYKDISPYKAAELIQAPTLIIHGKSDTYVPIDNGEMIFNALNVKKEFYWVDEAEHAEALIVDREQYFLRIKKFFISNNII